jgi:DNA (cytosine-5)-methyltransferase 1
MGGVAVIGDLASIGYNAEWRVISAASVGANHRRDRIIIVAYPDDTRSYYEAINPTETGFNALGRTGGRCENVANTNDARSGTPRHDNDFNRSETFKGRENLSFNGFSGFSSNVADTPGERLQGPVWEVFERRGTGFAYSGGEWWKVEPDLGRVANGVPARVDRLKGLGNAVVPQVAEIVGRLVVEHSTR